MSASTPTQDAIAECHDGATPETRLLALLGDCRAIVRGNALLALASRQPVDEPLIVEGLLRIASLAEGDARPLLGTMTERMMVAYALHWIDTPTSCSALRQVESMLSETETR